MLKLFYNLDRLDDELALRDLKSLYGMDIQSVNVDRTRVHLLYTIKAAYKFFTGRDFEKIDEAIWIIRRNIIVGDSLEFMSEMAARKHRACCLRDKNRQGGVKKVCESIVSERAP